MSANIDNIKKMSTEGLFKLQGRVYWLGFFAGISFSATWLSMFFSIEESKAQNTLFLLTLCTFLIFLIFLWMRFSVVRRIELELKKRCR